MTTGLFTLPLPMATADGPSLRDGHATTGSKFFAGPENALVRSLVQLVDTQFVSVNPLVLYGPTGSGKSSLALALAERRRERFDLASVVVTTGSDFARSLAHAIETDSVADHRAKHQRCDLLVIDDLHRLANKPAAQQCLVSCLDSLQKRGSLVIVTLPQSPQKLSTLTPAITSRLMGGLVVRLALPGLLARRELVRQAATRAALPLSEQELDRLAHAGDRTSDNYLSAVKIRELVLQLAAGKELGQLPDLGKQNKTLSRRAMILVAKHFALPVSELRGKSRRQTAADARALTMYLIRRLTSASYAELGRLFGNRDHTTVLHAYRKVESRLGIDGNFRLTVEEMLVQLGTEGAF